MYNVLYGDIHLHLPYSSDCLSEIDISGNINEPSTLTFEIPVTHSRYELISNRAHDQIKVMDDDTLLFCGFIYEIERDIYNTLTVTCKSDLKYLDDTVVRPYSTNSSSEEWQQGMLVAPSDPENLFRWYIEQHNSHCMSAKHFEIGTNEGWRFDANNYILRSSSVTPTTLTEISEKLVESLGGYLFVHYENGHRYIDWVENCESVSTQIIDFGVNITNFSRTDTTDGLYTAIRPEGRAETTTTTSDEGDTEIKYINPTIEIDGAGNPSGIPDGELEPDYYKDGDTIYCQSAVDKYGFIECAQTFEDCTTCKGLLTAGLKELKTLTTPSTSIDIGAYDLSALGVSDPLVVGTLVRVRSKPNNIDEYMLVSGCTLNLVDPSQTSYTLGIVDNALVQQLNASINSAVDSATSLREELERTGETAKDAKKEAQDAKKEVQALKNSVQSIAIDGRSSFKNNADSETLKIKVWCGVNGESTLITDYATLVAQCGDTACIRWFSRNPDETQETEITDTATNNGFSLLVNARDVDSWKYFRAGVYIDDVQVRSATRTMTDANDGFVLFLTPDNIVVPADAKGNATSTTYTAKWSCYWGATDYSSSATVSGFGYDSKKLKASYNNSTQTITITTLSTMTKDASVSVQFLVDCVGPEVWLDRTITLTLAKEGRGVDTTAQKYALSDSADTQPENWVSEVPTMTTDEPYLWTYDETTYTDATTSTTDPRIIGAYGETGETGETGTGVSDIVRQYAISTSSTTAPTSGWSATPPAYTSDSYYWERDYITWTTGDTTVTKGVLSKGLNSANSTALDAKTNASTALTNATKANNKMHYATCPTADATVAKVATLIPTTDTLTLTSGVSVSVKFTYANTADAPTLNVAGTGAKNIRTNGGASAYWQAGQSVLFTYDGTYWRVASEPVYASTVTVGNSASDNIYINSSSVQIRNGTTALANFTANKITMGKASGINAQVDSDSFDVCSGSTPYISMGYTSADGAIIETLNQKPLKLSTACDINGDFSWSRLTRSGYLSSWVERECSHGGWHITTYIKQSGQSYFYAEIIYSGSGSGTVVQTSYPGNFYLKTGLPNHASVSTRQEGTSSSYAGWVYADTDHVSFYPSNTAGTSGTTPFTVFVAGYFTSTKS